MKTDLEDGFARVSVTLLHAWALLKLSDCAKSCLMLLVADISVVTASNPRHVSSLKRYSLAKKLKHTFSCSAVYSAVEKLVSEGVAFVNDDGLIGIELEVFTGRDSDFQQSVEHLNRSRRKLNDAKNRSGTQESHGGKPETPSPDYSGPQEEYSGGQEISAQNYSGSQEKCSGKPEVSTLNCSSQQEHTSVGQEQDSKNAHAKKEIEGDGDEISSVVTNEIARANLPDLLKVFVPFVASKTLRSDDGVLADVKAVRTTAVKLFHALALVYRAVDDGAFPRILQAAIADAASNPRKWKPQDPLQLLKQLDDQRKRKDYHEHIRIARDKALVEQYQAEQKREQDRLALEKRKAETAKHHAEIAEDTKEDQSEATNHEAET